jgi:hypothetical protein
MATKLLLLGSEFQVNSNMSGFLPPLGTADSQDFPSIATLTDGRFAVVYQSTFSSTDIDAVYAFVTPAGVASQATFVAFRDGLQTQPVAAGRAGGGFGVAWMDQFKASGADDGTSTDINYTTFSSTGGVGTIIGIQDEKLALQNPAIATLSDGRQVIVYEVIQSSTDHNIHLNIVNAAGNSVQFSSGGGFFVDQQLPLKQNPAVAASPTNQALIVYSDDVGSPGNSNIRARQFDGNSNSLVQLGGIAGTESPGLPGFLIADDPSSVFNPDAAYIGGGRYAIVYTDHVSQVFAKIFDPITGFLSSEIRVDQAPPGSADDPAVAATADGGFVVTWTGGGDAHERRFDPYGNAFGDDFVANSTTPGTQHKPDVAVIGSTVLTAWGDDQPHPGDSSSFGVRAQITFAQVFDYNDQAYGDFDNNGKSDFLFQNPVTHQAQILVTSNSGGFAGSANLPTLPATDVIDGTGNFNSNPGSDILLVRNTTTIGDWAMTAFITDGVFHTFGSIPAAASYQGSGDFDNDGQTDILFLGPTPSGLQLVPWKIVENALVATPQGIGSFDPNHYNIVAISDFDGDHTADILFRSISGADVNGLFEWQIVNNQLAAAPFQVGSAPPGAHVVGIGDFNGDGTTDLLFRFDQVVGTSQPGQLAMWLLNAQGQLLVAPNTVGAPIGANWHVDGTGDVNGDGRSDIILRDQDGQLRELLMNGFTIQTDQTVGTESQDFTLAAHHYGLV